jgi:hypothetical protein
MCRQRLVVPRAIRLLVEIGLKARQAQVQIYSPSKGTRMDAEQRRAVVRAAVITIILGAVAVAVTGWPHGLFTAALIAIAFFIEKHL